MIGNRNEENRSLTRRLAFMAVAMFGFGFALVPLYDVLCEVAGLRASIEATDEDTITEEVVAGREITIELIAHRNQGTPLEFRPKNAKLKVSPGAFYDTSFFARNLTEANLTAIATPDIRPVAAAEYFRKIECFCFNEQRFKAGEGRDMPLRFFVDPGLPEYIDTVTLSYTMFERPQVASN